MRRALRPRRSDTKLDSLRCACSNRHSSWFRKLTLVRVNWYFRVVTVRHSRGSGSGTKLKTSSCATSRLQPLGQHVQFTGGSAECAPRKLKLAFPGDVGHHDRQHLLVNVHCCDSIRHLLLLWRSGEHAKGNPRQGHVAIAAPVRETNDAQLFAQSAHAPDQTGARSRLLHCPTDLTAPASAMMPVFHEISRAEGPSQQGRKTPPPHARVA